MDKREEIPQWALEEARKINLVLPYAHVQEQIAHAISQARSQAYEHAAQIAEEWEGPEKLLPMGTKEHNEGASVGMYEAGERIAQAIRQHSQKGGENDNR